MSILGFFFIKNFIVGVAPGPYIFLDFSIFSHFLHIFKSFQGFKLETLTSYIFIHFHSFPVVK